MNKNQQLSVRFTYGDNVIVNFFPSGIENCIVVGVHHLESKVLYDIDIPVSETEFTTINGVDSVFVITQN